MVPNHMFQLLAMIAMEPPNSFDADARADREGQGDPGDQADGPDARRRATWCAASMPPARIGDTDVSGYRQEPDVAPRQP